jgi:hypothetical protein
MLCCRFSPPGAKKIPTYRVTCHAYFIKVILFPLQHSDSPGVGWGCGSAVAGLESENDVCLAERRRYLLIEPLEYFIKVILLLFLVN